MDYLINHEERDPDADYPECSICGNDLFWEHCDQCSGEGVSHHDCGEDICCCRYPKANVRCWQCGGKGGWWLCLRCHASAIGRTRVTLKGTTGEGESYTLSVSLGQNPTDETVRALHTIAEVVAAAAKRGLLTDPDA
ncbi:MAG: hypothetical protein IAE99_08355 [Rhodothermales bacterium]|nr:hypothetical protein [Rhodothermales bacterium]